MVDHTATLVLNVDDYAPGRHARTRTLQTAGFDVTEAATGGQALELAFGLSPAIVLLDVNLPDINGFEVCRRLKAAPATRDTAVLHVSATHVQPTDHAAGIAGGADGYLTEPVAPAVLIATVNALLRLRRVRDDALTRVASAETARAEATTAARAAEAQLAALVWDLREPVSTIVGWTRTLEGGFHDPANVALALGAIARNAQLVSDRLDAVSTSPDDLAPPLAGLEVLVVEDEPDTRELVALVMSRAGARVTTASSSPEALSAVVRGFPDVMIADISLPGEDGYALMRRIRGLDGVNVRAIALTGWVRAEDETAARAAGFDAHVRKPADPDDLVALVARLAGRTDDGPRRAPSTCDCPW